MLKPKLAWLLFVPVAVAFSALILGFITLDARSNWIEGAQLVAAYLIMAVSFFFHRERGCTNAARH